MSPRSKQDSCVSVLIKGLAEKGIDAANVYKMSDKSGSGRVMCGTLA